MAPRAASRLESLGFTRVYEYKPGKQDWMAAGLPVEPPPATAPTLANVTRSDVPRFGLDERASAMAERMRAGGWDWAAIVNKAGVLLGRIRARKLTDPQALASEVMEEGPATYRPNVPLGELLDRMRDRHFDKAFVTDQDGRLRGLVTRRDIEAALGAPDSSPATSSGRSPDEATS